MFRVMRSLAFWRYAVLVVVVSTWFTSAGAYSGCDADQLARRTWLQDCNETVTVSMLEDE